MMSERIIASRAWQRMLSGRRLDLLSPSAEGIDIEDIAHGLSRVARWNGQTLGTDIFSVAQHCIFVEYLFSFLPSGSDHYWRLGALLHDGSEYVIGDLITPFKTILGTIYESCEFRLQSAIYSRFCIPQPFPESVLSDIKCSDRCAAYFESVHLAGFDKEEAASIFGPVPSFFLREDLDLDFYLSPMALNMSKEAFLSRFRILSSVRGED